MQRAGMCSVQPIHPDNKASQALFVCRRRGATDKADLCASLVTVQCGVDRVFSGTYWERKRTMRLHQPGPERPEVPPMETTFSQAARMGCRHGSRKQETLAIFVTGQRWESSFGEDRQPTSMQKNMKIYVIPLMVWLIWCSTPAIAARHNLGGVDVEGRYAAVFPEAAALPIRRLTPGALNPAVTQRNLRETICRPGGYTRSIRPSASYTERLKRLQIRQYGYIDLRLHDYEEDHLISLELGGSPSSPRNLWPEPHHVIGGWGSYAKDMLENRLHTLVCRGRIPLAVAQREIATNWSEAYKRYVGPIPTGERSHRYGG